MQTGDKETFSPAVACFMTGSFIPLCPLDAPGPFEADKTASSKSAWKPVSCFIHAVQSYLKAAPVTSATATGGPDRIGSAAPPGGRVDFSLVGTVCCEAPELCGGLGSSGAAYASSLDYSERKRRK